MKKYYLLNEGKILFISTVLFFTAVLIIFDLMFNFIH